MPLIGRWRLDERQVERYYDVSGQNNEGFPASVPNGPIPANASLPTVEPSVPAPEGVCPGFDGNAFVVVPHTGVNWVLEPRIFTVEACVLAEASPGSYRYVVAKGANQDRYASYALYTGADGGLQFYVADSAGVVTLTTPSINIWDGNWHHIAGTYNGDTVSLWVDGVRLASNTVTSGGVAYGLPTHNDLTIGNYITAPNSLGMAGFGFVGKIDEVRIWDNALYFE
jgi:hypothetical protein